MKNVTGEIDHFALEVCSPRRCWEGLTHTGYALSQIESYKERLTAGLPSHLVVVDNRHISWYLRGREKTAQRQLTCHFYCASGIAVKLLIRELPFGEIGVMAADRDVYRDLMSYSWGDKNHPVGLYVPLDELQYK